MKFYFHLFLLAAKSSCCFNAKAQEPPKAPDATLPAAPAWTTKLVAPPQKAMPVDDYLLNLANASDVNFVADVSEVPATSQVQPFLGGYTAQRFKWEPTASNASSDLVHQQHFALTESQDGNGLLLWPFLSREGMTQTANLRLGQLPAPLRDKIGDWVLSGELGLGGNGRFNALLPPNFWASAVVRYGRTEIRNVGVREYLAIGGITDERDPTMNFLERLDFLPVR